MPDPNVPVVSAAPVPVTPAAPAVVPAASAAPPTLAQQVLDSQVAPAAPAAPAAAPVVTPPSDAVPGSAPSEDSALKAQLADAEKRLQDTQRWGHKNAEEAAKLKASLTQIQTHPVLGKVLEAMAAAPAMVPNTAATEAEQAEMRQAWAEYQSAKSEEEAFAKILKFAELRGSKKAMSEVQTLMTQRENEARAQQRTQLTVQAINKTVSETATDVPLELFWAMSSRAEAETPATITDYTERLQWQVGRAIDLSRAVLGPRVAQAAQAATQQAAVNHGAGAIMAAGGAAPSGQPAGTPAKIRTMADVIKDMQRAQMEGRKV